MAAVLELIERPSYMVEYLRPSATISSSIAQLQQAVGKAVHLEIIVDECLNSKPVSDDRPCPIAINHAVCR